MKIVKKLIQKEYLLHFHTSPQGWRHGNVFVGTSGHSQHKIQTTELRNEAALWSRAVIEKCRLRTHHPRENLDSWP